MKLVLDEDVNKTAEFMMQEVDARKLCFVAHALAEIADLLWAHYASENECAQVVKVVRADDGVSTSSRELQPQRVAT